MIPPDERYDLAHFEFVMRGVQELSGHGKELPGRKYLTPEELTTFLHGLRS